MPTPIPSGRARDARAPAFRIALAVALACWLAAVVVPPLMLARVRATWLEELDLPQRQSEWDTFRSDMRRQSGRDGPVQRKVPRSAEPPARVWLRDYFPLAVAAWMLFAGVLGGVFCLFVVGTLTGRGPATGGSASGRRPAVPGPRPASLAQDETGRQHDGGKQNERDGENAKEREHGRRSGGGGGALGADDRRDPTREA
jgi:hypothetical protein